MPNVMRINEGDEYVYVDIIEVVKTKEIDMEVILCI
jgi:hypothetical protein